MEMELVPITTSGTWCEAHSSRVLHYGFSVIKLTNACIKLSGSWPWSLHGVDRVAKNVYNCWHPFHRGKVGDSYVVG